MAVLGVDFFEDFGGLFTGDSSRIGEVLSLSATDLRLRTGVGDAGLSETSLGGIAPLLTGVDGGSFLSKCSGDSLGPNETLFLFADGARFSSDFLFLPLLLCLSFSVDLVTALLFTSYIGADILLSFATPVFSFFPALG